MKGKNSMDDNRRIEQTLKMIAVELKEIRKVLTVMNSNYICVNDGKPQVTKVLDNQ